ncbi:MAG: hypothetical protein GX661_04790 [Acholeplasmataceae bacterium]|nr:hypothetical protein [Acholeplasmataceae bacterium]
MIDVHTHILPFIDDGSPDFETSLKMLTEAEKKGISDIILTPHALRLNIKPYSKADLLKIYAKFCEEARATSVRLHLGQEISCHRNLLSALKNNDLLSINNSNYLLLELPFTETVEDFDELVYSITTLGYQIIIAHIERYMYLDYDDILSYCKYPVMLQVNSGSIIGANGKACQKLCLRLISQGFVKLVGSDVHSFRTNDLDEAYSLVSDKFGTNLAKQIFIDNPKQLFNL